MRDLLTVLHLTLFEAMRRRILSAALLCGGAFLVLFGIGIHFIARDMQGQSAPGLERRMVLNFITLAGLYAVNFLTVMSAVLLPVDTLSGEIDSGVSQTLASKPIRRSSILLGKWAAYLAVVLAYLLLMAGGVVLVSRFVAGFTLPGFGNGLPLMMLEATILTSLSIAGGTRLSTVTNGVMAFGFYGIAFIGGWVEQIGAWSTNDAARHVGVVASLIMPSESMWQLAASQMQPTLMREMHFSPFSPASVPSPAMVAWAAGHAVVLVLIAVRSYNRRPL